MTDLAEPNKSVRANLALSTQDLHDALHHDVVLSRLTAADITPQCYCAALSVLQAFYLAVERARTQADLWQWLSLDAVCTGLHEDLGPPVLTGQTLTFASEEELLGGLYVAHGASFGRSSFRANITDRLPQMPQAFLTLRLEKPLWRALMALLEARGSNRPAGQDIERGAAKSFAHVAALSALWRDNTSPDAARTGL